MNELDVLFSFIFFILMLIALFFSICVSFFSSEEHNITQS